MPRLATLIVDDEPKSRRRLRRLLEAHKQTVEIVAEAGDGEQAEEALRQHAIDLVFLDIVMPKMDGLTLASGMGPNPTVIFVTGHAEYAVAAFETFALHFLVKPVSPEHLGAALNKVLSTQPQQYRDRIPIRAHGRVLLIETAKVATFESDHKYTAVKLLDDSENTPSSADPLIDLPLVALEATLDPKLFARASRSALVNLKAVSGYTPLSDGRIEVHFRGLAGHSLVASRRFTKRLKDAVSDWAL
jgi:two-component system response regulator AlgR